MTVTKLEARRMIAIAGELIRNNAFSTDELIRRVRQELPHATLEDLIQAISARIHAFRRNVTNPNSRRLIASAACALLIEPRRPVITT